MHPAGPTSFGVVGDLNDSGSVNVADAMCALNTLLWQESQPPGAQPGCLAFDWRHADVTCDGAADVADVVSIVWLAISGHLAPGVDPQATGCADACAPCHLQGGGSCLVGGCVPEGQAQPASPCSLCIPAVDAFGYSVAPDNWPCGDGKSCNAGACVATPPGAPVSVSLDSGREQLSFIFLPPASNGGSAVTDYTVSCTSSTAPNASANGAGSPIVVSGLQGGATYTCAVHANNAVGAGSDSAPLMAVPTSCDDGVQNGLETGTDCGADCGPSVSLGGGPENPAASCLAISQAGAANGNGLYWLQLNSGVTRLYCHFSVGGTGGGTGWTRVGALDGGQDYCTTGGTTDLRSSPEASAGKIPDTDVHGLLDNTPGSPKEVMFFVRDNNRWVWHSLNSVGDFNTNNKHTSSSYYCGNWHCFGGGTDGSSCGGEGNGCPVTAHGHGGGSKKIYVDSSFSSHNRGLHYNGSICGEPNYSRAAIWVLVR
jgi:hypothetical protein